MSVHYDAHGVAVHRGDCLDVLRTLPACSVDSVVTDPPYELGFMGRAWDGTGIAYRVELWAECLRVLKPGGHMLAFGGTRTWHRLACAIEDAGFEIRDTITWLYGSGFPKSLDVGKAIDKAAGVEREVVGRKGGRNAYLRTDIRGGNYIGGSAGTFDGSAITAPATEDAARWDGWGTALKPASEPIVVARKPLAGTVAANVLTHGTGALNVAATRVGTGEALVRPPIRRDDNAVLGRGLGVGVQIEPAGRWPSNVVLSHSPADPEDGCEPSCPVAELDAQSGTLTSGANPTRRGTDKIRDAYGDFKGQEDCAPARGANSGGASRFFPTFRYEAKADATERHCAGSVAHPTVKPLDLMRWLVRLVTPPGGLVLDPFGGSGTTAEACLIEGFRCVTIEREADYLPLIVDRITKRADPVANLTAKAERGEDVDLGLFGLLEDGAA